MGNANYKQEELAVYRPPLANYMLTYTAHPLAIYRHNRSAEEVMEFRETIHNRENVDRKLQTFYARHQHPYLVATLYVDVEGS
jgi:hypothetical protein